MTKMIPILTFLLLFCSCQVFCQSQYLDSIPLNLGKHINTKHPDIAPVISPDGKTLYFSKDHYRQEIQRDQNHIGYLYMVGVEYQHIYYSTREVSGEWSPAKRMEEEMNNSEFNSLCSISPDGNSILIYKSPKLFISKKNGNTWGSLIEQKIDNFYDSSNFCNFFLSNSGKYLLSAVTRNKKNKEDLFVSFLLGENHWSKPKNLGPYINSKNREISPFLASDDRTIYFAADHWGGLGEMDIYVSHRHDSSWTDWSPPKNLGAPINSEGWDAYLSLPASGDSAYFVSTQSGFGQEDIFKIKLPEWARPHPLKVFSAKVFDRNTKEPISSEINFHQVENEEEGGRTFSDPLTGEFKIAIHPDEDYNINIKAKDYFDYEGIINSDSNKEIFYLPFKIVDSTVLKINNIYFNVNESMIRPGSMKDLYLIGMLLKENQDIKIKLNGYADNSGGSQYNLYLSERRALAVKEKLIEMGVGASRIIIKGYGEEVPENNNDSEEERKKNRRVEFEILTDTFIK